MEDLSRADELIYFDGLGPKSSSQLKSIGIHTKADLLQAGAISAFLQLKRHCKDISLNVLYVLVGIIEDKSWREIAATQREQLLLRIDGYRQLEEAMSGLSERVTKPASSTLNERKCN